VKAAEGTKFTVPNLGEREFIKNAVVITGPPTVFDKDNIDNFDF
jgi:rhamnose transport system substrate-binding protein